MSLKTARYGLLLVCLVGLGVHNIAWGQPPTDSLTISDEVDFFRFQTEQGRWNAGANFGFGLGFRTNQAVAFGNGTSVIDLSATPRLQYYLWEGLAVGVQAAGYYTVANIDSGNDYALLLYGGGPLLRYYAPNGIFGEFIYAGGWGEESVTTDGFRQFGRLSFRHWSAGLGLANFWLPRLHLELLLRYARYDGQFERRPERFFLQGLGFTIGATVALGR